MKYAAQGKRSRAWWLQAIKWFGDHGRNGIAKEAKVSPDYVTEALSDLKSEGYVVQQGDSGKGNRPKYLLTDLGGTYLARNQDELQDAPAPAQAPIAVPKPAHMPVFTWKRVLGGQVRYFMDGQMVSATLVPDAEVHRMVEEIRKGESQADEEPAPAEKTADVYTWQQPPVGPVRYFCNGKFLLQTQIPMGELRRMQREQDPEPATPPVSHPVPTVPEFKGPALPKAIAKELSSEELRMGEALDMTPEKTAEAKADTDNMPARINKEQGSEKLESDKNDKPVPDSQLLHDADQPADIQTAQKQLHRVALEEAGIKVEPAPDPVTSPQIVLRHGKKNNRISPNSNELTASGQSFKDAFREVLVEILLEKFAGQVTAADVMERLEGRDV